MDNEDYQNDRTIILRRDSIIPWMKSLTKREKVFFILNCITLLTTLILVILLGTSKNHDNHHKEDIVQICLNGACLQQASYIINNINQSADPCEDFYSFACGNFASHYPPDPKYGAYDMTTILEETNTKLVRKTLEKLLPNNQDYPQSSERKLKSLYRSCIDRYERLKLDGQPLLQIIQDLGGWDLLETWDEAHFNKNNWYQKIRIDHWINVFFKIFVNSKQGQSKEKLITVYPTGVLILPNILNEDPSENMFQAVREEYKDFMVKIVSLLIRDSGINMNNEKKSEKITTFINEVLSFEKQFGNISDVYYTEEMPSRGKITLAELNVLGNAFDWISLFKNIFGDNLIYGSTELHSSNIEYLIDISNLVKSVSNRTFHNYLIWRLILNYAYSLSYEYAHLYRSIERYNLIYSYANDVWKDCLEVIVTFMEDILKTLYIEENFTTQNFDIINTMGENIKASLLEIVEHFNWMDEATKTVAKKKINGVKISVPLSNPIANRTVIDEYYEELEINETNYFQNRVNLNQLIKKSFQHLLLGTNKLHQWSTYFFHFYYIYNAQRNEIVLPLSLFIPPIYNTNLPYFMYYANLGFFIAKDITESILGRGKDYDENGVEDNWWSNETSEEFMKKALCINDQLSSKVVEINYNGTVHSITLQPHKNAIISHMTLMVTIMQVYKSYKIFMDTEKLDSMLPGLPVKSNEQGLFLSMAQLACTSETEEWEYRLAKQFGNIHMRARLMHMMSQIPEFSNAFHCSPASNARKDENCHITS